MKYLYVLAEFPVRIPSLRFFFPAFGVFSLRQCQYLLGTIDLYINNFILFNMAFVWCLHNPLWNNQVVELCQDMETIWQLDRMNPSAVKELHWNISSSRGVCKERLRHSVRGQTELDIWGTICIQEKCDHEWYLLCKSCNQSKTEKRVWYRLRCICLGHSVPSVSIYWQTQRYISDMGAMACSALLTCSSKGYAHEPLSPDEVQESCIFLMPVSTSN